MAGLGEKNRKEGEWGVYDLNARETTENGEKVVPRVHEPKRGTIYGLVFNEPYWMPEMHARVFLRDPAFRVIDENGDDVAGLNASSLLRTAPTTLPSDMVIASLAELTTEALVTRVALRPGGNRLNGETPREVLIRFLIDGNAEAEATKRGALASDEDPDLEDMGADDSMLTGA